MRIVGTLLGTRDAELRTPAARARMAYDGDRLALFEVLRAELAAQLFQGRPRWRVVDRAQRWASLMTWTGHDRVIELLEQTNALADPDRVEAENPHLLDPGR
jgi:hypothetical protein